jgi:hypothetical protein
MRYSNPSVRFPCSKRVRLHVTIAPVAAISARCWRTFASGTPVSLASSASSRWPCFLRQFRISATKGTGSRDAGTVPDRRTVAPTALWPLASGRPRVTRTTRAVARNLTRLSPLFDRLNAATSRRAAHHAVAHGFVNISASAFLRTEHSRRARSSRTEANELCATMNDRMPIARSGHLEGCLFVSSSLRSAKGAWVAPRRAALLAPPAVASASNCRWCSLSWQYKHSSSQLLPSGGLLS